MTYNDATSGDVRICERCGAVRDREPEPNNTQQRPMPDGCATLHRVAQLTIDNPIAWQIMAYRIVIPHDPLTGKENTYDLIADKIMAHHTVSHTISRQAIYDQIQRIERDLGLSIACSKLLRHG